MLDYDRIKAAEDYPGLMFVMYAALVKMEMRGLSEGRIADSFRFFLEVFCQKASYQWKGRDIWEIFEEVTEVCGAFLGLSLPDTKEGSRIKHILFCIYRNIKSPELSLQYLAREVLFMNEDYFGRFFYRCTSERYSLFLVRIRMELAMRLMAFDPDIRISELAEQAGYPADGQYFAKVFKKRTGMVPSEYKRTLTEGESRKFTDK